MTVHENKYIRPVMRFVALAIFKLSGWKTQGKAPDFPKCVVIAAPHTSNWDFVYTVCTALILGIKPVIMMKDSWFQGMLASFFLWLGAIPIDRSAPGGVVGEMVREFEKRDELALIVAPSGTRKKVSRWKSGFYRIAFGANVPVVLGFLDYRRKIGGVGPSMVPTGDMEADMVFFRKFYSDIEGKKTGKKIDLERERFSSPQSTCNENRGDFNAARQNFPKTIKDNFR